jgi:hypothetical protein
VRVGEHLFNWRRQQQDAIEQIEPEVCGGEIKTCGQLEQHPTHLLSQRVDTSSTSSEYFISMAMHAATS